MAARRRPITYAPLNDNNDHENDAPPVRSSIMRYALSDGPLQSSDSSFDYDKIDAAVTTVQQRFSTVRTSPSRQPSLPPVPEASEEGSLAGESTSLSRNSSFSGVALVGQRQQALEYLPTINSGEPLEWDGMYAAPEEDPFADSHAPQPAYRPPALVAQNTSQSSLYDHASSYYTPERTSWTAPSRPMSAYSAVTSVPSNPTGWTYAAQEHSASAMYPADTSIDHFRHDTEAYASGTYSRPSYRPPRSRSPTPAVDDEDYQIKGDGSIHYTGYTPSPQRRPLSQVSTNEQSGQDITYRSPLFSRTRAQSEPVDAEKASLTNSASLTEPETPRRVLRRHKTKKRVQLTNGNLLVLPRKGEPETMKTRYTAVTCDPDDFEKRGFFLRQNEMRRTTELFIVITMYNEDEILFCRTMYGVMRNIAHLCSRKNSRTWAKMHGKRRAQEGAPASAGLPHAARVYQPGDHMKNMVNNKPYTTTFGLDENLHFKYPDKGIVPTQIIFCMKEKNQKKINSHRWFFNAFGSMLQVCHFLSLNPNVCVLLDVARAPVTSIYHLWKAFDVNSNHWRGLLNPLVAAQNFEYKITNILDKPTESLFGYISVLIYRAANDKYGFGPLASYFKGEVLHGRDTDIFTSNMSMPTDASSQRILCFELVAKANSNWILKYVKSAIAETDFISQRRRWLNGSFFAATYAIAHLGQILRSGHSVGRKVMLVLETIYNVINLIAAWFAVVIILTSSLESKEFGMPGIRYFNAVIQFLMAGLVIACFLFSMGNKPKAAEWKYKICALIFAVLMVYVIFCAVMCSIQAAYQGGTAYRVMLFSIIMTYGAYAASSVLAFDPWHMFTSFIPTCFCPDISWGTKQDNEVNTDLGLSTSEVPTDAADVNSIYEEALDNLKNRKPLREGEQRAQHSRRNNLRKTTMRMSAPNVFTHVGAVE
ncbi:chitin synthase-domain-containing protein, partial [Trametes punicea]